MTKDPKKESLARMVSEATAKKDSIQKMVREATARKYGLEPILHDIEMLKGLVAQLSAEALKGADGKTPVLGEDYFTATDQARILRAVTPKKGVHYFDGKDATGVKGDKGDIGMRGESVKGDKGDAGRDGTDLTAADFIESVNSLKGKEAAAFSQAIGAKIDISHVRNAGSFIFNGNLYKTEELMHGGGSSSTGSTLSTEVPVGVIDGSNNIFTVTHTPVFVMIDGNTRVEGYGYTYAAPTITVDPLLAPTQAIISFYNA